MAVNPLRALTPDRCHKSTGEERQQAWQEVFRRVHEGHVADIMMFYMVGYTRVGPRVDSQTGLEAAARRNIGLTLYSRRAILSDDMGCRVL